jgi:hypothetical protein
MRRLVLFVGVVSMLLPMKSASSGGSWLDVQNGERVRLRDYDLAYAGVGSVVTMRGTFTAGQQAAVNQGPWYAYLRPDQGKADPVRLGTVQIQGEGFPYVATTTFAVPRVAPGYYWVDVCDLGCNTGVGDLIGGTIVIASTDAEARLFARALIFEWSYVADARAIERLRQRQHSLRAALADAKASIDTAEGHADAASQRASEATDRATQLQAALGDTAQERDAWRIWGILGSLALLISVTWALSLRRRIGALIPDSPQELEKVAGANSKSVHPSVGR